ncbi:uncharacterized protein AKAW2_11277S [Aspergillus luchuensis]|uniref:Uncharacterized protein n=1 Tax=Aspergillus kawachii TaxID=1069201 RepID=A0A7R7W0T9_ASPKA|nr:uncharacterized protein AKAW2_11277S [Aspergillus luchuensis]BCR94231.1 hypothetical protein AKAW2_11277S [Aspergillus luchuensis]
MIRESVSDLGSFISRSTLEKWVYVDAGKGTQLSPSQGRLNKTHTKSMEELSMSFSSFPSPVRCLASMSFHFCFAFAFSPPSLWVFACFVYSIYCRPEFWEYL